MDVKEIADVGLFAGLSKKDRGKLARWADQISLADGHRLATEGEFAHEFFVIEEGSVTVTRSGETIAELGPGEFFGEIGLLRTERRTATVVATSPVKLIVMFKRHFRQMNADVPAVAEALRSAIRARLAD